MSDMFDRHTANLSGIIQKTNETFFVSTAIHKAFIEINEEGSEAAAASETFIGFSLFNFHYSQLKANANKIEMFPAMVKVETPYSMPINPPPKPKEFFADHPFIFYILDKASETIVFSGRVTKLKGPPAPKRWSSYFWIAISPSLWF